jgi:methionine-rich copper-binding protein CopC
MPRSRKLIAALVVGVTSVCGLAGAGAQRLVVQHATVRSFTPAPNTVTKNKPTLAAFVVAEPDRGEGAGDFLRVYDSRGAMVSGSLDARSAETSTVLSTSLSTMATGWYLAHWNVESEDGHMAGGDDGKWWVFGDRVRTTAAAPRSVRFAADVSSLRSVTVTGRVSGARVGARTVRFGAFNGQIEGVRIRLVSTAVETLRDATVDWIVSKDRSSKRFVASGVFPVAGTYELSAQASVKTTGGSTTGVWRTTMVVRA